MYDAAFQREPKWSHLKDLHKSINLCKKTLLTGIPGTQRLGPDTEVKYLKHPIKIVKMKEEQEEKISLIGFCCFFSVGSFL